MNDVADDIVSEKACTDRHAPFMTIVDPNVSLQAFFENVAGFDILPPYLLPHAKRVPIYDFFVIQIQPGIDIQQKKGQTAQNKNGSNEKLRNELRAMLRYKHSVRQHQSQSHTA